jgi:hypothetical protein
MTDARYRARAGRGGAILSLALVVASSAAGQTLGASPTPPPSKSRTATADEAADAADAAKPTPTVSEVTVTAKRTVPQYGAVVGDIKPELQLGPADVQSYGVSTVTDLLNELAPETRSDRGRSSEAPVILLNGRRISAFNEVRDIPVEAILRVDILPEEVSLKYGYTADQRVVNIVLRRRFDATTLEGQGGGPTEGGEVTGQAETDLIHIRRNDRLNLDLKYQGNSQITDAARGIIEPTPAAPYALGGNIMSAIPGAEIDPALSALAGRPVTVAGIPADLTGAPSLGDFVATANTPNATSVAPYRTLTAESQTVTANAVLAHPLPHGVDATLNATLSANQSIGLQGLPGLSLDIPAGDPFSPFSGPVTEDRYVNRPLRQYVDGWTAHLGGTLNKDIKDWRLSLTQAYDHADTQTDTDTGINLAPFQSAVAAGTLNPFGPLPPGLIQSLPQSYARSISDSANAQVLANGPLIKEPAGNIYVSAKAGDTQSWQSSYSARGSATESVYLTRNDLNAQLSLDVPLASREKHVLAFAGDLSVNGNAAIDRLSDYGTLKSTGFGVNWTPIPGWNLVISHTNDQQAPSVQQLGGPVIVTPNVPIFDYVTGQSVDVTQISGGNRGLVADNRNVMKIGLTVKPLSKENLTVTANYIKSDIDHPTQTLPALTSALQQAFASRFVRDAEGQIIEFDDRPVNFARSERTELRWGFNYWRPLGPQPRFRPGGDFPGFGGPRRPGGDGGLGPAAQAPGARPPGAAGAPGGTSPGPAPGAPPGAGGQASGGPPGGGSPSGGPGASAAAYGGRGFNGGGGRGGGRGFGFGLDRPSAGRLQIAVYHTIYFKDQLIVAPGGPTLDLLNGAPSSSTGGQYRNEVEAQAGFTLGTYGARFSADWKSATFVDGQGTATGNLYFSSLTTLNLRLFDNLGQDRLLVKRYPLLKGVRLTLGVTNLLDDRITVRNAAGVTPLSYQAGYIDPVGRAISLNIRKLFY